MNKELKDYLKVIPREQRLIILDLQSQIDQINSYPSELLTELISLRDAINDKVIIMNGQIESLNRKLVALDKMAEITPDSDFYNIIKEIVNSILTNDHSLSDRIVNEISKGISSKLTEMERRGRLTIQR